MFLANGFHHLFTGEREHQIEFARRKSPSFGSTRQTQKECEDLDPGLDKLRLGVDITTLDLSPQGTENTFKGPVIDYTCNKGRKVTLSKVSKEN